MRRPRYLPVRRRYGPVPSLPMSRQMGAPRPAPPRVGSRSRFVRWVPSAPQGKLRTGLWIAFVVALIGAVFALAGYRLFQVARYLDAARDQLELAERQLLAGEPAAARAAVTRAHSRVSRANSVIHGYPELGVLNLVPGLRQNLAGVKAAVEVGLQLTTGGRVLLETAVPLEAPDGRFEVPMRSGTVPVEAIRAIQPQLRELATLLPTADEAPRSSLQVGPVRDLVDRVYRQSDLRRQQAKSLAEGLDLLAELSGMNGPRRFMLAIANAAEMRGTGGMILSYGELVAADGTFALENFGRIDDIRLPEPAAVEAPADYVEHYLPLGPSENWRNANLGVDFTYVGRVMEVMYERATGKKADGVIQLDSMGLAALMRGTGPVTVEGLGQVTADNVVEQTISRAYEVFDDQPERREVMADVAEAVFQRLVTGDYPSLRPLATALVQAAAERRFLIHFSNPSAQRNAVELGVDGALPQRGADFATLSVQNFSGNKLDYYIDTALRLVGDRRPGATDGVTAEITVTNNAPVGRTFPQRALGPHNPTLRAGQYVGLVTLHLPVGTLLGDSAGDFPETPRVFTEAGRTAIAFAVDLQAGEAARVRLDLVMPPAPGPGYELWLLPFSRVRPTVVAVDLDRGGGRLLHGSPLRERTVLR